MNRLFYYEGFDLKVTLFDIEQAYYRSVLEIAKGNRRRRHGCSA